jgi:hypothetical protein
MIDMIIGVFFEKITLESLQLSVRGISEIPAIILVS